jgi:hypothetical protein
MPPKHDIEEPMPKSKSKRNRYVPPPPPKPKPSPKWIPYAFFTLIALGFLMIMARYLFSATYPFLDNNWFLGGGLAMIAVAFGIATNWR